MMRNGIPESIQDVEIKGKRVIVRVDFDVSMNPEHQIIDDQRIVRNLPTLKALLKNGNRLVLIAKLGRPEGRDPKLSLKYIVDKLPGYLPGYTYRLIDDFMSEPVEWKDDHEILILENIRFYPEEEKNDPIFAKKLADLGDIFVNDAFAMAHRSEASTVGITHYLPSYAGLLLAEEVSVLHMATEQPKRPLVTVIGGAKVSDKIGLLTKLLNLSDYVLIGGAMANTFLKAHGYEIGESRYDKDSIELAAQLLTQAESLPVQLLLPSDAKVSTKSHPHEHHLKNLDEIEPDDSIYDIGPLTSRIFQDIIGSAQTVFWNGPMGYIEDEAYRDGTDAIYTALCENRAAKTIVGGGDTLAAIGNKHHLDMIDHISTGGGAMLEYIEKGTLPGIEALRTSNKG